MPRLFTALELPVSVAGRLSHLRGRLSGARWVDPENYHITLRFAGDIDHGQADEFAAALGDISFSGFSLSLKGLGCFGNRRPRSLWAGVDASEPLMTLQAQHERAARIAGLGPEGRNYSPHVTLARLKGTRPDHVAGFLQGQGDFVTETFDVVRFVLFSSRDGRGGGPYVPERIYPVSSGFYEDADV